LESEEQLIADGLKHPSVQSFSLMSRSHDARASRARASRYPDFRVGFDFIEVGPSRVPGVTDSGKDAMMISFSMSLPFWWESYLAEEDEAQARSASFQAYEAAAKDRARRRVATLLSRLRDSARRVSLYRDTLIPQAETVYGSVLAGYQTGEANIAEVLLAHRNLLDLSLGLYQAQASHAMSWSKLESVVGRSIAVKN
jgi:outer membrane protein, heavy metal efflux system